MLILSLFRGNNIFFCFLLFRLLFNSNYSMRIKNFIYIFLACYTATFLRVLINNNLVVSIIGSLFFGFVIAKRLSYSREQIILSGFLSCFTSFSGFIYFLYKVFNEGDLVRFAIILNLIIIINLFTMYIGFLISRKIT